ncbi:hypothetical protein ABPG74_008076 [Tetrahymena malaccensis]
MGFFNFFSDAVSSIRNTYQNVKNVVKDTLQNVVQGAKTVVKNVGNVINKAKDIAKATCNKISQKINESQMVQNFKNGIDYLMNDTEIGKFMTKVGKKVGEVKDSFMNDTALGRQITKFKEKLDQTGFGKFMNAVGTVIQIGSMLIPVAGFVGIGGLITKAIQGGQKIVNIYNNLSGNCIKFLNENPIVQSIKGSVSKCAQDISQLAQNKLQDLTQLKDQYIKQYTDPILKQKENLENKLLKANKQNSNLEQLKKKASNQLDLAKKKIEKIEDFANKQAKNFQDQINEKANQFNQQIQEKEEEFRKYQDFAKQQTEQISDQLKQKENQFNQLIQEKEKELRKFQDLAKSKTEQLSDELKQKENLFKQISQKEEELRKWQNYAKQQSENLSDQLKQQQNQFQKQIKEKEDEFKKFKDLANQQKKSLEDQLYYKNKEIYDSDQNQRKLLEQIQNVEQQKRNMERKILEQTNTIERLMSQNNQQNTPSLTPFRTKADIEKVLQNEKYKQGASSANTINSYTKKYSNFFEPFEKFKNVFEYMEDDKFPVNGVKSLNSLLGDGQLKLQEIYFNKNNQGSSHTIDGKLSLTNQSGYPSKFFIPEGQIFGNKQNNQQHVVVRGFQGNLRSNETKTFYIEGFCADKQLSWPNQNTNYEPTNLKLKKFNNNTTQSEVWDQTN